MFLPDELHEFSAGVWKATLIHLLRLLYALGGDAIQIFNSRLVIHSTLYNLYSLTCRFRRMPTFGRDTIRKFTNNVAGQKQMAARDYEDILQVCCGHLCIFSFLIAVVGSALCQCLKV